MSLAGAESMHHAAARIGFERRVTAQAVAADRLRPRLDLRHFGRAVGVERGIRRALGEILIGRDLLDHLAVAIEMNRPFARRQDRKIFHAERDALPPAETITPPSSA